MKKKLIYSTLLFCQAIYAVDDYTQLRLSQEIKQQQFQAEKQLLKNQDVGLDQRVPNLVIQGQTYTIEENNPAQLAQALYLAVMQKQWQTVVIYLEQYKKVEHYDQALTAFVEGALLRAQGDLKLAEQKFKNSLEIQPNNLITELELARVLFEQQKNKEASERFHHTQQLIQAAPTQSIPKEILNTVQLFQQALAQRDAWQGSVAFGAVYATNINNSAEYYNEVIGEYYDQESGQFIPVKYIQGSPDPINSTGLDYEATLSKRWSLAGQHGIAFRGLSYGQIYTQQPDYNDLTINLNAGYSYQSLRDQISVAPVLEHKWYGHDPLYNAYGVRGEWMRFISNSTAAKIEAEIKDFNYSEYKDQNGIENSVFTTFWKILPHQWSLFAGLDYVDHNTEEKYMAAYEQQGVRLGVSKNFDAGFNATFFSSYRWRQFDKFAPVLETRRHDFEQNYTFVVQMPRFEFYGLTPNLTYRYNHNRSNVDWLYSYDKHNVSLKLEHRF